MHAIFHASTPSLLTHDRPSWLAFLRTFAGPRPARLCKPFMNSYVHAQLNSQAGGARPRNTLVTNTVQSVAFREAEVAVCCGPPTVRQRRHRMRPCKQLSPKRHLHMPHRVAVVAVIAVAAAAVAAVAAAAAAAAVVVAADSLHMFPRYTHGVRSLGNPTAESPGQAEGCV